MDTDAPEYDLYQKALEAASAAYNSEPDDGYGCGSSFVVIKYGTPFMRWAKRSGMVKKDSYYGWVLDTTSGLRAVRPDGTSIGTLAQERSNEAFAKFLSDNGIHAFNHTYLT